MKRKCDKCGSQVAKRASENTIFHAPNQAATAKTNTFGANVNKNSVKVSVGEPIMVNPNSYANCKVILNEMKPRLISNDRKWAILGCDGPPYCLASRIIQDNPDSYDWVTLMTGLGHLHMNQLKSFFKVADQIVLEPLGKEVLGFVSDKAYQYFINAKDTHKTYDALRVLLEGTAMEMCMLFVNENRGSEISANLFFKWCSMNCNETFSLLYQLIFNFALAVYVQKVGIRANNWEMIDSGRMKFLPFFLWV